MRRKLHSQRYNNELGEGFHTGGTNVQKYLVAWRRRLRECWPQMLPTDKATWRKRRLTLPDVVAWPKAEGTNRYALHFMWGARVQQCHGERAYARVL